jgi:phosphatidylglycerophosphate synthase
MKRISFAVTYRVEAIILDFLVSKLPKWVSPDLLTLTAFLAALFGGLFYILAGENLFYLHLVSLMVILHWFADSLDGRVARYRKVPRPNYGYFVDHILDSASTILFLGGLTVSAVTSTSAWLWVGVLYLLMMIHIFLKARVFNTFQLSLSAMGPTEARIGLILVNTLTFFFGSFSLTFLDVIVNFVDIVGLVAAGGILAVLIPDVIYTSVKLNQIDRKKI